MKIRNSILVFGILVQWTALAHAAEEFDSVKFGDAEVVYHYQPLEEGSATLTMTSLVYENNDSFRGVKNSDQRRLSKLGQLLYQCKLLLYKPDKKELVINEDDPILVSKTFSLSTDVDLRLSSQDSVAIKVQALDTIDVASVFKRSLGKQPSERSVETVIGQDTPVNLKRLTLDMLNETDLLTAAESVDINVRFPALQVDRPVRQWNYSFNLNDFKRAKKHTDENCTLNKLIELAQQKG